VQTNDGGNQTELTFERFNIQSIDTAMFIGHQQRLRENVYTHHLGYVHNVLFRDIVTHRADRSNQINSQVYCDITGNNIRIQNIIFENITHHTAEDWGNRTLPPFMNGAYPDANGFGPMPAFGLFARNVTGLHIIGSNTFTGTDIGMRRPMFVFDDVIGYSGAIFNQHPPEIAVHLPVHARFPMRDADYVAEFRVTDTAIYRQFRPWTMVDGTLTRGSRWANNYWVTRSNAVSQQFSVIGHQSVQGHMGTGFAKGPNNDGNQTREYIFLNLPENWNDNGLPASSEWENYHISVMVRPGVHERWREPATTSIVYRAPSGLTGAEQNIARDHHMSVNLARSNRGFVRLGGRGQYMAPGATEHVLQVGLAEVAHPQRGGPVWDDTPFFQMDIIVDGPYISIYVDGIEFVRDFYDEVWDLGLPYSRRGTVGLGGNAGANAEFTDFSITRIYQSELLATSGTHTRLSNRNFFIPINHMGNYVFRVRNTTTGAWLEDGVDFTRQWPYAANFAAGTIPGITLQSSYLNTLAVGRHNFELVFNLGGTISEDGRFTRAQAFELSVLAPQAPPTHPPSGGYDTGDDSSADYVPTTTPTPVPATPTPVTPTPTPTPTPAVPYGRVTVMDATTGAAIALPPADVDLPGAFVSDILERDALNAELLDEMFKLADSNTIARVYVGDLNLTDEQLVMLVGFMFNPDTGEYEVVRGFFSDGRNHFNVEFDNAGVAGFMLYQRPVPLLRLTIGQVQYDHNGAPRESDAAPFIIANRTMVPLRLISEALGATPRWDNETRTAYIYKDDAVLRLPMGQPLPGGLGIPEMRYNRVFVPARFVIENFDAVALWNGELQQVTVYTW